MNNTHTRQFRELNDAVKRKISAATKGKPKSEEHKRHISQSMKDYWQSVPSKSEHTTMQNFLNPKHNNMSR